MERQRCRLDNTTVKNEVRSHTTWLQDLLPTYKLLHSSVLVKEETQRKKHRNREPGIDVQVQPAGVDKGAEAIRWESVAFPRSTGTIGHAPQK
jgi:hypothetical protein